MGRPRVVLYSRADCHLCDEARDELTAMEIPFAEIDIEGDPELHTAFLERIPVVEVDGHVVSELGIDEPAVRTAITWAS